MFEQGMPIAGSVLYTLITTYTVTVDGKTAYQGEDWGLALAVFQLHAWNINHQEVTHKVERKLVPQRRHT